MKRWIFAVLWFLLGIVLASAVYTNIILFTDLAAKEVPVYLDRPPNAAAEPVVPISTETIEREMPMIAVDQEGIGRVGKLRLKMIPGNANVLIDTNPFLEMDIQYSANVAVTVAKLHSERHAADYDFILSYEADAPVIGGGSAGAATTIAVMAALQGREINTDIALTGEIYPDGTIGKVGGVVEKAQAVAEAGFSTFLVPEGQGVFTYYERVVEPVPAGPYGFVFYDERFIPQTINLIEIADEEWGLEVVEVSTIDDVADRMLI